MEGCKTGLVSKQNISCINSGCNEILLDSFIPFRLCINLGNFQQHVLDEKLFKLLDYISKIRFYIGKNYALETSYKMMMTIGRFELDVVSSTSSNIATSTSSKQRFQRKTIFTLRAMWKHQVLS